MHGMNKRLVVGLAVIALAMGATIVALRERAKPASRTAATSAPTPMSDATKALVAEFRAVERASLRRYNDALADQRANRIDELELASFLEREVLPPWRAVRERVTAAVVPTAQNELYETLKRYLEARQLSWEAYAAGLRANDDAAARPHYDAHHQKSSEANAAAQKLGVLFRERGL